MFSETFGLFPKSVTLAGAIYLGLSWLLAGTFSERLAEWKHIPACVAGLKADAAAARHGLPSERQIVGGLMRGLLKVCPELNELPGVGELTSTIERPQTDTRGSGLPGKCRCLASVARQQTRTDFTLWVATFRVYEPDGVRHFPGVMARVDRQGICGKGG